MTIRDAREKIREQLDMTKGRKQLNLKKRKVPVNKDSFNLIIGSGGTGCHALIETKGLIDLSCIDPDSNVVYIPFDTDRDSVDKLISTYKTGRATLPKGTEIQTLLRSSGLGPVFAPVMIDNVHAVNPEIFEWVDTNLPPAGADTGAGGIRQLGRMILMTPDNLRKVRDEVQQAINKLAKNGQGTANAYLNVYILSGISGGTGSGTFLDMAMIVRDVLSNADGFVADNHRIYGYLFMPDINESQSGTDSRVLNRNAYAALQELDYNLSLHELEEQYTVHMRDGGIKPIEITAGAGRHKIFDYIHLVSALKNDGTRIADPYENSMYTVAQSIFSFVANESGATAPFGAAAFAMAAHYNNIDGQISVYKTAYAQYAHRNQDYLAIGSCSYDLPIDDMMMYIASKLFEKLRVVFDQYPKTDDEYTAVEDKLGIRLTQLVSKLENAVPQLKFRETAQGQDLIDYYDIAMTNYDYMIGNPSSCQKAIHVIVEELKKQFDNIMADYFTDKTKGPVYGNCIIVDSEKGLLDKLRRLNSIFMSIPDDMLGQYIAQEKAALDAVENAMRGLYLPGARRELLAAYNAVGKVLVDKANIYILKKCIAQISKELHDYIAERNSSLYDIVSETVLTLDAIFEKNADILKGTISTLDTYLTTAFNSAFNAPGVDLIGDFLHDMWVDASKWMENYDLYDPKQFVSDYIDEKFGALVQNNIEDIVLQMLAPGIPPAMAYQTLLNKLITDSAPLFYPKAGLDVGMGNKVMLISVPDSCPNIANYLQANAPSWAMVQRTAVNTRIYAQSVQCGIMLAHYQQVWDAEAAYAQFRGTTGLHLVDPRSKYAPKDPVSWKTMPTLIPRFMRLAIPDPAIEDLLKEEDADKDMIKRYIKPDQQGNYSSIHPAIELDTTTTSGFWKLKLKLSDVQVERIGTRLEFKKDGRAFYICDYENPEENLAVTERKLKQILTQGFGVFPDAVITEKKYWTAEHLSAGGVDGECTLDNLTEIFIQAIYAKHALKRELEKYETIQAFHEDESNYTKTSCYSFDSDYPSFT